MRTMTAARKHSDDGPMVLEEVPVPEPRPTDVLIAVKACGMVPNLGNVLRHWKAWFPNLPLPEYPAVFGLDPAGVVERVGSHVHEIRPGDRVYANPGRSCGSCRQCRGGEPMHCRNFTFQGYFGFGPDSQRSFSDYPFGGFAQYTTVPQSAIVKLPDNITFEQAARFGYLGTAHAALKVSGAGTGTTVLINGITGTLGLGAALLGLAMGVPRIFGTGRDRALLERVKALAPSRIEVAAIGERSVADWAFEQTGGDGVDVMIDALGPGAPAASMNDALKTLRRGGKAVDIGGMDEILPLDVHWMMDARIHLIGSCWFTTGEGQEMADMAERGLLDLSVFEHKRYPLVQINEAISGLADRNGGFTNFVVTP